MDRGSEASCAWRKNSTKEKGRRAQLHGGPTRRAYTRDTTDDCRMNPGRPVELKRPGTDIEASLDSREGIGPAVAKW